MNIHVPDDDALLTTGKVAARYDRHIRSIDRWLDNPAVGFPQPDLCVNSRRFWRVSTLRRWEISQATSKAEAA
jgi:hypothetical protein